MPTMASSESPPLQSEVDVVVIGAGMAGIYMLYKLRELGLSARVFEAADDVGGTWYWNRYPGARCDIQSIEYCYSFSREVNQEWTWSERYATQGEILRYMQYVVDRFDLRRSITFKARVSSMVFDDAKTNWLVRTDTNEAVTARFCISAVGCISLPLIPKIPGVRKFPAGSLHHTGRWPHEPVDFSGKRVGVVGTGSSAVQLIPELAKQAGELFVFQRTPNHAVPANNYPLPESYSRHVKQRYEELWKKWIRSPTGGHNNVPVKSALDMTDHERESVYQSSWSQGGFDILYTFDDILTNQAANDTAADFVRRKVREIVKDPTVAEQLVPAEHPLGTKRLCLTHGYYETFNRPNVHLVSAQVEPIVEIEESGVRTSKELYQLDSLIFATGYDAITGSVLAIDIRGRGGRSLREEWGDGAGNYLGVAIAGFPNLFLITGPGSPSVLYNVARPIEQHVEWITNCLAYLSKHHISVIEPTKEAQTEWMDLVNTLASKTLFPKCKSWYNGDNVNGKPRQFLPFVGFSLYQDYIDKVANDKYVGFVLSPEAATQT
ncbi:unnamed protein product [Calypogeia fissa]